MLRREMISLLTIVLVPVLSQVAAAADGEGVTQTARVAQWEPKLPLTDSQKKQLGQLNDRFEIDTALPRALLKVSQHQLFELLSESPVDRQAALTLQGKIDGLKTSLAAAHLKLTLDSCDVFTPEQRAEMKKMHLPPPMPGAMPGFAGPGPNFMFRTLPADACDPGFPPAPIAFPQAEMHGGRDPAMQFPFAR